MLDLALARDAGAGAMRERLEDGGLGIGLSLMCRRFCEKTLAFYRNPR
jgi:hypothetical protein